VSVTPTPDHSAAKNKLLKRSDEATPAKTPAKTPVKTPAKPQEPAVKTPAKPQEPAAKTPAKPVEPVTEPIVVKSTKKAAPAPAPAVAEKPTTTPKSTKKVPIVRAEPEEVPDLSKAIRGRLASQEEDSDDSDAIDEDDEDSKEIRKPTRTVTPNKSKAASIAQLRAQLSAAKKKLSK
jgi:hypothetical protein